jgi:hypothetical protein
VADPAPVDCSDATAYPSFGDCVSAARQQDPGITGAQVSAWAHQRNADRKADRKAGSGDDTTVEQPEVEDPETSDDSGATTSDDSGDRSRTSGSTSGGSDRHGNGGGHGGGKSSHHGDD